MPASIGDFVWHDENQNGIQDEGEPGIPGVTVNLYDSTGTQLLVSILTNADGLYEFTDLMPGDHIVEFELPSGYSFTSMHQGNDNAADSDANLLTGRTEILSLSAGEVRTDVDAGIIPSDIALGKIGDWVWHDLNQNGIQDANEPGRPGVTVRLLDPLTDDVIQTTISNYAGFYEFSGLPSGEYVIQFELPQGSRFTSRNQGEDDSLDSDPSTELSGTDATGRTEIISLEAGEIHTETDAGLFISDILSASLGDFVWDDENQNGIQDEGELGIPRVTVNLYDSTGTELIASALTNRDGLYEFTDLNPGSYIVEFGLPTGYSFTSPSASSDTDTTGRTEIIPVAAGERNLQADAGMFLSGTPSASIGDFVWNDENQNGVHDEGEPGIPGVTVNLYDSTGTELLASTVTNADGLYVFSDLASGDYVVEFGLVPGYRYTSQNQGDDPSANSDTDTTTGRTEIITLEQAGENHVQADAGMFTPSELVSFVWHDTDEDGIQDEEEPGIPGVTVNLYDSTGTQLLASTTTDSKGYYVFTDLLPGDYVVEFEPPPDYILTLRNQGQDSGIDSDADTVTGRTVLNIVAGQPAEDADAGLYIQNETLITIGDLVWLDVNGDGSADPGEGLPGVTVKLYDGKGELLAETMTDTNGIYRFLGLIPGDYRVEADTEAVPSDAEPFSESDGVPDSVINLAGLAANTFDADFGYRIEVPIFPDITNTTMVLADVNGGEIEPGDVIWYAVTIYNAGKASADNVVYTGTPNTHTSLVRESVSVSQGTVVSGNREGDEDIVTEIGSIPPGESVVITYFVQLGPDAPPGTSIEGQGVVAGSNFPEEPTDFPDTFAINDPTATAPIGSITSPSPQSATIVSWEVINGDSDIRIVIEATPGENDSVELLVAGDSLFLEAYTTVLDYNSGSVNPGDILEYSVTIINTGEENITGIVFHDSIAGSAMLIPNTVSSSQGSVTQDAGGIAVLVGDLGPGESAEITFQAMVAGNAPNGSLMQVHGRVSSNEFPDELTDDPFTPTTDDPTVTVVVWEPSAFDPPTAYKTATDDGFVIYWEMVWMNDSNENAILVHIEDDLPEDIIYVQGSVEADYGEVWYDEAENRIIWEGELPGNGGEVKIWYHTSVPEHVSQVKNQASAVWDHNGNGKWRDEAFAELPRIYTDDPLTIRSGDPSSWSGGSCELSLGNMIWYDANADGVYSPGTESGINGIRINLYRIDSESRDGQGARFHRPESYKFVDTMLSFTHNDE